MIDSTGRYVNSSFINEDGDVAPSGKVDEQGVFVSIYSRYTIGATLPLVLGGEHSRKVQSTIFKLVLSGSGSLYDNMIADSILPLVFGGSSDINGCFKYTLDASAGFVLGGIATKQQKQIINSTGGAISGGSTRDTSGYPIRKININGKAFNYTIVDKETDLKTLSSCKIYFLNTTPTYMVQLHIEPLIIEEDDIIDGKLDLWILRPYDRTDGIPIDQNGLSKLRIIFDDMQNGTYDITSATGKYFSNPIVYARSNVPGKSTITVPLRELNKSNLTSIQYIYGGTSMTYGSDWQERLRLLYHEPSKTSIDGVNIREHTVNDVTIVVPIDAALDTGQSNVDNNDYLKINICIPRCSINLTNYDKIVSKISNLMFHVTKTQHSDITNKDVFDTLNYQSVNFRYLTEDSRYPQYSNIRFGQ